MTPNEVNEIIQKEYSAFNEASYQGEKLPNDLMERFRVALFSLAPSVHQMSSHNIKKILAKKVKDLTNYEVGHILNLITAVPFNVLYKTLDEAVVKNEQIEGLKVSYNLVVKGINETVEAKRMSLLDLSGARGNSRKLITA